MAETRDVFVHPQGLCESSEVGAGTRIWAFAHVVPGARIGRDCNICNGVFVEDGATVGDRVTVKSGVQLWQGVELRDDVFVGPNATFSNNRSQRSRQRSDEYARTVVHEGASIGANATILPGLDIGRGAMVGAGAVVTLSVPAHSVVTGNPARITGYTTTRRSAEVPAGPTPQTPTQEVIAVRGVHVQHLPEYGDLRGRLSVGDLPGDGVPFAPRRWFLVYDVPSPEVRGEHAHRVCHQFLLCVAGSVTVAVDDGERRATVVLDRPSIGLYIPPLVWSTQFGYEAASVLLVMASHPYDAEDYIREYDQFLIAAGQPA